MGIFSRLKEKLTKTREGFVEKVETLVTRRAKIDEELYEELEEILIQADVGVNTALELVEELRDKVKERNLQDTSELSGLLQEIISETLGDEESYIETEKGDPTVIVVVGVNGVGKTTTIGKLAHKIKADGKKVLLAAGDTFRAAAIDQLEIWGSRVGCDVIKHKENADPGAVVYDAIQAAKARGTDVLIIDTAGRLHTKANLMEELKKVHRIIARELPDAPQEVLLILDATTGQNAISQAKLFGDAVGVTGLVLTKLDGTAKGGVIIGIKRELDVPVKLIGIGEQMEDLRQFKPQEFAEALFDK